MTRGIVHLSPKTKLATLREPLIKGAKLNATTLLRQVKLGRQGATNLPVRRSGSEGGKELGYGE